VLVEPGARRASVAAHNEVRTWFGRGAFRGLVPLLTRRLADFVARQSGGREKARAEVVKEQEREG